MFPVPKPDKKLELFRYVLQFEKNIVSRPSALINPTRFIFIVSFFVFILAFSSSVSLTIY